MKSPILTTAIALIAFVLTSIVEAKQVITLKGDDEVSVWASTIELNRIKVIDDRVKHIRANEGELELISDQELGEVYIKPKAIEATHIFITTEKGYTYKVGLKTDQIAAQQIFLKNEDAQIKEASKLTQKIAPDRIAALELIKSTRSEILPPGYIEVSPISSILRKGFRLFGRKKYKGEKFICEKFLIKVNKNTTGLIKEETFFAQGVIAVSLDKYLKSGESGHVYIVTKA